MVRRTAQSTHPEERSMTSTLNPYIHFDGNAKEALEFYQGVFEGSLNMSTFGEFGAADAPHADKIMHGQLETKAGYTIMASDTPPEIEYTSISGMSISISGDDG